MSSSVGCTIGREASKYLQYYTTCLYVGGARRWEDGRVWLRYVATEIYGARVHSLRNYSRCFHTNLAFTPARGITCSRQGLGRYGRDNTHHERQPRPNEVQWIARPHYTRETGSCFPKYPLHVRLCGVGLYMDRKGPSLHIAAM